MEVVVFIVHTKLDIFLNLFLLQFIFTTIYLEM
jgi:hypothetical protein